MHGVDRRRSPHGSKRRGLVALGSALAVVATMSLLALPAGAQDEVDVSDLIPEGTPGELDLTEEDERFGRLVSEFGETTAIDDFGDGSKLTGPCGGYAFSYSSDGELIDAAFDAGDDGPPIDALDGGQAFTSGNPFRVDTQGQVAYFGFYPREGEGPRDHVWDIATEGISLDSGGDPNTNGNNRNAGIVDLGEQLPFPFTAKGRVEGSIASDLPPCFGQGFVQFEGTFPLTSLPGAAGGLAALVGVFGLLFNARPAITWKA